MSIIPTDMHIHHVYQEISVAQFQCDKAIKLCEKKKIYQEINLINMQEINITGYTGDKNKME